MTYARVIGTARITTGPDASTRTCARCGIGRAAGGSNATTCRNCLNKSPGGAVDLSWQELGVCLEHDPETWFPPAADHAGQRIAQRLCKTCPVIADCLEWALLSNADFGVWGGATEDERRAIKRRNRGPKLERIAAREKIARRARELLDPTRTYTGHEIAPILGFNSAPAAVTSLIAAGVVERAGQALGKQGNGRMVPTYRLVAS